MRRLACLVLAGVVAGMTADAGAEVRLRLSAAGRPTLVVKPVSTGPWGLTGPSSSEVLNLAGDTWQDSYPSWVSDGSRLLVAWTRPHEGVVAASSEGRSWQSELLVASGAAVGTPQLRLLDQRPIALWQEVASAPTVQVTVVGASPSPTVEIGPGWLAGSAIKGDVLHAVTLSAGLLTDTTIVVSSIPNPEPIEIPSVTGSMVIERMGPPLGSIHAGALVPGRTSRMADADLARAAEVQAWNLSAHGEIVVVLGWWVNPQELHWVRLGESGPLLPIGIEHGDGAAVHPHSLIEHALQKAAGR